MDREEPTSFSLGAMLFGDDRIGLRPDLGQLDDSDLHRFIAQAQELQSQLVGRWPRLADVFAMLALIAGEWDKEQHGESEGRAAGMAGVVRTEPTSPIDHLVDEYGRALAFVMPLAEDPEASEPLRLAWISVMRDLSNEVRMRQFKRLNEGAAGTEGSPLQPGG